MYSYERVKGQSHSVAEQSRAHSTPCRCLRVVRDEKEQSVDPSAAVVGRG